MTNQQRAALALANKKRKRAATFKKELRAMTMDEGLYVVADLVETADPWLDHLRVRQAVAAVRYCGPWHVDQVCRAGGVNRDARLRELTPGRRAHLAATIRAEAARYHDYKAKAAPAGLAA